MGGKSGTPAERFWRQVNKEGPAGEACEEAPSCWLWKGCKGRNIQGQFKIAPKERPIKAHIWAWQEAFGAVPAGYRLQHLCGHLDCVRPQHLTLIVYQAPPQQSDRHIANAQKASCPYGHLYDAVNTRWSGTRRHCKQCEAARNARRYNSANPK